MKGSLIDLWVGYCSVIDSLGKPRWLVHDSVVSLVRNSGKGPSYCSNGRVSRVSLDSNPC